MADMSMAFDWTSIALGLAGAAVPLLAVCWQLQRRLTARMTGWELLEERLATAQLAQEGLAAQLDASRDEISDLSQANAAKQADLAAVRREVELLHIDRAGGVEPDLAAVLQLHVAPLPGTLALCWCVPPTAPCNPRRRA